MNLTEQQLAVVLQACIEHAKELLAESGGFLPFGARAKPEGEVEFLEARGAGRDEPLEALRNKFAAILAEDARENRILASALVANASLPAGFDDVFDTAIGVLIEAPEFCRSIVVPYRIRSEGVELGEMIPEEADPAVFVD
jgi:hypothetical protein